MRKPAREDRDAHGGFRPPTGHTAAASTEAKVSTIALSFDPSTQELGPLLEAAYCLMSQASCYIDSSGVATFVGLCRMPPTRRVMRCGQVFLT